MVDELTRARMIFRDAGWNAGVAAAVGCIPAGFVLGYRDVGVLLGRPRSARQVGYALSALPTGHDAPWWRVVRSNGTVAMQGDPARGARQVALLRQDGVVVSSRGRIDMSVFRWMAPIPDGPG